MTKSTGFHNGKHYEWERDESTGELRIMCTQCEKVETLTGEKADRFDNLQSAQNYTCLSCWRKNKDKEREEQKDEVQKRIEKGQCENLAVASLPEEMKQNIEKHGEAIKQRIEFFSKLLGKNGHK